MDYVVEPGDTLWSIAARRCGDPYRWQAIANENRLQHPHRLIVGQRLTLHDSWLQSGLSTPVIAQAAPAGRSFEHSTSVIPGRAFFFVLADEVNPMRPKVVRKVMVNGSMAQEWARRLGQPVPTMPNPEKFGLHPTDPHSPVSLGRHAMGMKPSPFSSASTLPLGTGRISGSRFWIDVKKAEQAGATLHDTAEIVADLDRIAAKARRTADVEKIERIKGLVRADAEVAIKGSVPASAIKGPAAMALTRGLQGVQVIGFAMTAIDVKNAVQKSVEQQSIKPVTAESIRQVGGWASAWAGVKLGGLAGAAVGIETGPGAVVTGAVGAIAGGVAGYMGFDWIADHIDEN
jgi:hypothetical protein